MNKDLIYYLATLKAQPSESKADDVSALRVRIPKKYKKAAARALEDAFDTLRSTGKGLFPKTAIGAHMDYCKALGPDSLERRRHNILIYRYLMTERSEQIGRMSWKEIAHHFHVSKETAMLDAKEAMRECMLGLYGIPFLPEADTWEKTIKDVLEYYPLQIGSWWDVMNVAQDEPGQFMKPWRKVSEAAARGRDLVFKIYVAYSVDGGKIHAERFRDALDALFQKNDPSVSLSTEYKDKRHWISDLALICRYVTGEDQGRIRREGGRDSMDVCSSGKTSDFSNIKD